MSDNEILLRLQEKKTQYPGVKALLSYWSTPINSFEDYDGVVEIMSARKPSPSFLIRALSRSGRGLLVIGPDEKSGSHYLPCEEQPSNIVEKTRSLLKLVGISPYRIQYKDVSNGSNPHPVLKDFSKSLDDKKLKNLIIPIPNIKMNPIIESITLLRILSAYPDMEPQDDLISISSKKPKNVVFFEGCLPMLNMIGISHKLFDLSSSRQSIHKLLNIADINYGSIPGLLCPSKGLLELKIDMADDIVKRIDENNIKNYDKINPDKLILGTPESFMTFSKLKDYKNIVSLPSELFIKLKIFKGFSSIKKTIAIHSACHMDKDPFYDITKKLLMLIPDISIIELNGKCNHNGFDNLNSESKQSVLKLLREADKKDVDSIICTSPYCESHFLLCQREGSWRTFDIEITDVYKILLKSLGDGDTI